MGEDDGDDEISLSAAESVECRPPGWGSRQHPQDRFAHKSASLGIQQIPIFAAVRIPA